MIISTAALDQFALNTRVPTAKQINPILCGVPHLRLLAAQTIDCTRQRDLDNGSLGNDRADLSEKSAN